MSRREGGSGSRALFLQRQKEAQLVARLAVLPSADSRLVQLAVSVGALLDFLLHHTKPSAGIADAHAVGGGEELAPDRLSTFVYRLGRLERCDGHVEVSRCLLHGLLFQALDPIGHLTRKSELQSSQGFAPPSRWCLPPGAYATAVQQLGWADLCVDSVVHQAVLCIAPPTLDSSGSTSTAANTAAAMASRLVKTLTPGHPGLAAALLLEVVPTVERAQAAGTAGAQSDQQQQQRSGAPGDATSLDVAAAVEIAAVALPALAQGAEHVACGSTGGVLRLNCMLAASNLVLRALDSAAAMHQQQQQPHKGDEEEIVKCCSKQSGGTAEVAAERDAGIPGSALAEQLPGLVGALDELLLHWPVKDASSIHPDLRQLQVCVRQHAPALAATWPEAAQPLFRLQGRLLLALGPPPLPPPVAASIIPATGQGNKEVGQGEALGGKGGEGDAGGSSGPPPQQPWPRDHARLPAVFLEGAWREHDRQLDLLLSPVGRSGSAATSSSSASADASSRFGSDGDDPTGSSSGHTAAAAAVPYTTHLPAKLACRAALCCMPGCGLRPCGGIISRAEDVADGDELWPSPHSRRPGGSSHSNENTAALAVPFSNAGCPTSPDWQSPPMLAAAALSLAAEALLRWTPPQQLLQRHSLPYQQQWQPRDRQLRDEVAAAAAVAASCAARCTEPEHQAWLLGYAYGSSDGRADGDTGSGSGGGGGRRGSLLLAALRSAVEADPAVRRSAEQRLVAISNRLIAADRDDSFAYVVPQQHQGGATVPLSQTEAAAAQLLPVALLCPRSTVARLVQDGARCGVGTIHSGGGPGQMDLVVSLLRWYRPLCRLEAPATHAAPSPQHQSSQPSPWTGASGGSSADGGVRGGSGGGGEYRDGEGQEACVGSGGVPLLLDALRCTAAEGGEEEAGSGGGGLLALTERIMKGGGQQGHPLAAPDEVLRHTALPLLRWPPPSPTMAAGEAAASCSTAGAVSVALRIALIAWRQLDAQQQQRQRHQQQQLPQHGAKEEEEGKLHGLALDLAGAALSLLAHRPQLGPHPSHHAAASAGAAQHRGPSPMVSPQQEQQVPVLPLHLVPHTLQLLEELAQYSGRRVAAAAASNAAEQEAAAAAADQAEGGNEDEDGYSEGYADADAPLRAVRLLLGRAAAGGWGCRLLALPLATATPGGGVSRADLSAWATPPCLLLLEDSDNSSGDKGNGSPPGPSSIRGRLRSRGGQPGGRHHRHHDKQQQLLVIVRRKAEELAAALANNKPGWAVQAGREDLEAAAEQLLLLSPSPSLTASVAATLATRCAVDVLRCASSSPWCLEELRHCCAIVAGARGHPLKAHTSALSAMQDALVTVEVTAGGGAGGGTGAAGCASEGRTHDDAAAQQVPSKAADIVRGHMLCVLLLLCALPSEPLWRGLSEACAVLLPWLTPGELQRATLQALPELLLAAFAPPCSARGSTGSSGSDLRPSAAAAQSCTAGLSPGGERAAAALAASVDLLTSALHRCTAPESAAIPVSRGRRTAAEGEEGNPENEEDVNGEQDGAMDGSSPANSIDVCTSEERATRMLHVLCSWCRWAAAGSGAGGGSAARMSEAPVGDHTVASSENAAAIRRLLRRRCFSALCSTAGALAGSGNGNGCVSGTLVAEAALRGGGSSVQALLVDLVQGIFADESRAHTGNVAQGARAMTPTDLQKQQQQGEVRQRWCMEAVCAWMLHHAVRLPQQCGASVVQFAIESLSGAEETEQEEGAVEEEETVEVKIEVEEDE